MFGMIATSLAQVCAFLGLILCFSYYLSHIRREYQLIIIFLLGDNMSSYYWEIYFLVMGREPEETVLTYIGWNIGYVMLFLLVLYIGERESRRFLHPLMLLPVPAGVVAFHIFIGNGNILNVALQCVCCTLIAVFAIQGLLYQRKRGAEGNKKTAVYLVLLLYALFQFGASAAFELGWTSGVVDLYSLLNLCNYIVNMMLPLTVARMYGDRLRDLKEGAMTSFRRILRVVFVVMIVGISVGGYALSGWMGTLLDASGDIPADNAAQMIRIMLFVISGILSILVLTMMLALSFRMREQQQVYNEMVLRLEKQSADAASAAKSGFLADMSHEIRTPINAVLGMNEMILRESKDKRITTYARNVESAGKNLLSIINDILDFSKIEAGKMEIVTAPYQLSSVLNDVSNMITFRARSKDLDFHVDVDETIPDKLYGDEVRVRQIITNLLTNAVKYTHEGSVTLSVGCEKTAPPASLTEGKEDAPALAGGITLVIDVKDTGIGIKDEDLGNLFTKFGRVDLTQTNTIEGTGLGLAITENLLLMMQGDIKVQSVYGEGSTFSVRIPQGVVSEEAIGDFHRRYEDGLKSLKAYHESFRAPDAHVLVVDDTELNLVVIEGLLKTTEVRLDTASGGEEALVLCKKTAYDLILLDQRMPRMNGTETLRHIRAQEDGHNRETPVICLTADAVQGARERYLEEGFSGYLSKPVEGHALEAVLMEFLPAEKIMRMAEDEHRPSGGRPSGADRNGLEETGDTGLHGQRQTAAPQVPAAEVPVVQAAYDASPALHYTQAKEFLPTDELIEKTLRSFYENLRDTTDVIERTLREEDYDNFTIRVHALKSSARLIGATEISELAAKLEACGDVIRK